MSTAEKKQADQETIDEGVDLALIQLCNVLGVSTEAVNWDAASETFEGDVQSVICSILRAKYGEYWSADDGLESARLEAANARIAELELLINSPETDDWLTGARLEAAHQVERYGAEHDAGKTAWDWFWLIGYLAQKAAAAQTAGDSSKAKHHTISTAAALLNWHRHLGGIDQRMRPGIDPVERGIVS
ncbi:hypothetical protein [Bosea massiliensis]|uniref:Uncharacterized protein n=1 Tax=Bosea massiliensis TaxID=151419 RepID=A0ABW0NZ85_9HYPH